MNAPQQPAPSNRKSPNAPIIGLVVVFCLIVLLARGQQDLAAATAQQVPAAATASASNDRHAADDYVRKFADDYVRKVMEKQGMVSLAYKRSLVPHWLYRACVRLNSSYVDANDCLDKAVLTLPTGSVPGTWRLDANSQAEKRVYWSFADCDSIRVQEGSGVCVTN
jgi:hypothetical protein